MQMEEQPLSITRSKTIPIKKSAKEKEKEQKKSLFNTILGPTVVGFPDLPCIYLYILCISGVVCPPFSAPLHVL